MKVDPFNQMPFRDLEEVDLQKGILRPSTVEANVTSAPYEIINPDQMDRSPYFSCGRIDMRFPTKAGKLTGSFHGSAAAIDQNLLVTAAHNFLPSSLDGKPNKDKVKAKSVHFLHLHTAGEHHRRTYTGPIASSHCFIHPEWEKEFNPHYDIAFMFLSESFRFTLEEKEDLLKFRLLPHTLSESIQIVGSSDENQLDAMQVVYHNANTEPGSSGSPIVKDNCSLVDAHASASKLDGQHNHGVRIRYDLMPFLEKCLESHQSFLANSQNFIEKYKLVGIAAKQKEIADIEARGEARGEVRGEARGIEKANRQTALALMEKGMDDSLVHSITGLPLEDIAALRKSR